MQKITLVIFIHKNTVVLNVDTINTSGNDIETFVKRK